MIKTAIKLKQWPNYAISITGAKFFLHTTSSTSLKIPGGVSM